MNKKPKEMKLLEEELEKKIQQGQQKTLRTLNDEERKYVCEVLGLDIEYILYEITSRKIPVTRNSSHILKLINRAWKADRTKKLYMRLSEQDKNSLQQVGIDFKPAKYAIALSPRKG